MQLPVPSNCCCCFTLRTGTLILGWLSLVGSCLNVLGVINQLAMLGDIEVMLEKEIYNECDAECQASVHNFIIGLLVFSLVLDAILITISALLIYGVNKKKAHLMTPYLGYMVVCLGLTALGWIVMLVFLHSVPLACLIFTIMVGLVFALNFHFFTVIKGHQNEIIGEQNNVHIRLHSEEAGFAKDY